MDEGEPDWRAFYERNFCHRQQRRFILLKWQTLKWEGAAADASERIAHFFERFLRTLLYEPPAFHLRSDCILVFGDRFPVRLEWLSAEDQRFCAHLFQLRERAFAVCKEYISGQIDYASPLAREASVFDQLWRHQLVRDFVHIVHGTRRDALVLELIAALQWLLQFMPASASLETRRLLRALLAALQGRCELAEVMCIE